MMPTTEGQSSRREAIRRAGSLAARNVREAIGHDDPRTIEIEIVAFMRGALVRRGPVTGARANLMRLGDRGVIGVSNALTEPERRWAIAHELGHFELHPDVSFESLCSNADMLPTYRASGREPEANAFAAELLMPEVLFAPRCCDLRDVSWSPIQELAKDFAVSEMAAAIRFVSCTKERVAVVCSKNGVIQWASASMSFGPRPKRGNEVDPDTIASAFFSRGESPREPCRTLAAAWLENSTEEDLLEHVLPIPLPSAKLALSLLWLPL